MNSNLRNKLLKASILGAFPLAIVLIHYFEGIEYKSYHDVTGTITVCAGITGKDVIEGKEYTQQECDALLEKHISIAANAVDSLVKVDLSDNQKAALYSFAYNVGTSAFANSTLLKKLNAGQRSEACCELRRWIYAAGKPWKGLMTRRQVEEELCQLNDINEI